MYAYHDVDIGVASTQHICAMSAINYLRNDAGLDETFSKDEAASVIYYLYCNWLYMCVIM